MPFSFHIPTLAEPVPINVEPGTSIIFVGANGSGKTRLAVHIEDALEMLAHRVSAQRSLVLNTEVSKIKEDVALSTLRTGSSDLNLTATQRTASRWQNEGATQPLNDFGQLVQVLFADQARVSHDYLQAQHAGNQMALPTTKLRQLAAIWQRLLPQRELVVSGDDVMVRAPKQQAYKCAAMSDGERAIFYLIGQTLVAAANSMLIVDEPELHVHRSIMSKLWDELEAARPDCAFAFITHDLEFAAARAAKKFVIQQHSLSPLSWTLEEVAEHDGFSEELATLILGSRHPVLFVEGDHASLDIAFYRACFPKWMVVPKGSCEQVIHSVASMKNNQQLHRIKCAGMVDADGNDASDIAYLASKGVYCLPVSEIENLPLLPEVSRAILKSENYKDAALEAKLSALSAEVFAQLQSSAAVEAVVLEQSRRRIDRATKMIDLSEAITVADLDAKYRQGSAAIDVQAIAKGIRDRLALAQANSDLAALLVDYSNKGLMAIAARHLRATNKESFEAWLTRSLASDKFKDVKEAVAAALPTVVAG